MAFSTDTKSGPTATRQSMAVPSPSKKRGLIKPPSHSISGQLPVRSVNCRLPRREETGVPRRRFSEHRYHCIHQICEACQRRRGQSLVVCLLAVNLRIHVAWTAMRAAFWVCWNIDKSPTFSFCVLLRPMLPSCIAYSLLHLVDPSTTARLFCVLPSRYQRYVRAGRSMLVLSAI